MNPPGALVDRIDLVAARAVDVTTSHELRAHALELRARLHRPLRVAIAGRAKAGKSTLLNALVGERLAATDATECTRIVTWYREDLGYSVTAHLRTGEREALEFERGERLQIHLSAWQPADVARIEVGWPSSRLAAITLIDTPGLDGPTPEASATTPEALLRDPADPAPDGSPGDADAVIYLIRHLHRSDADFLEAFGAHGLGSPSPASAIAILSRADELGAGRPDALVSAAAVARRYAADPRIRPAATDVLPVVGLLAETGASLRESEVSALRQVAAIDADARDSLLLSVDRFRGPESPLAPPVREELLRRFGLFGLRRCSATLADRPDLSAVAVARLLVELSGIRRLEQVIAQSFARRAEVLKARSALANLRLLARAAASASLPEADALVALVERAAATSPELEELRILQLLRAGEVTLAEDEITEVERLLGAPTTPERLAQPGDTALAELARISLAGIERWRTRLAHPVLDPTTREAAEVVARRYEALYQEAAQPSG